MPTLHPHIFFNGKAEEAFNFYKSVLGGEFLGGIYRYAEAPDGGGGADEATKNWVMHVSLPIGPNTLLMGADYHPGAGKLNPGNNFSVYIDTDSRDQADAYFKGLLQGGKVDMPQEDTFWGSYFGGLTDKFGVSWMIAFDEKK